MTGFVYAIGDGEGRVKIGWSADPVRRRNAFATGHPGEVELLGIVPATREQEQEAHQLLRKWRISREWYRFEGAVAKFVAMLSPPVRSCPPKKAAARPDSIDGVIEALGGSSAVRKLTGQSPQGLHNWRKAGRFPSDLYVMMTEALHRAGRVADPKLWGQR